MLKLLDNEELQRMVDYSFGDHSGVLGGVPNAYMKHPNWQSTYEISKFLNFLDKTEKKIVTLFIDNIRLYNRPLEYSDWLHTKPISPKDREWLKRYGEHYRAVQGTLCGS
jgi:hypothetical protein